MIPYGCQNISETDIEAVIKVLKSDWLTQGPVICNFEQSVAKYCGASSAVAVNSGTSALHVACLALGLKAGDYLWTSPNSFVASANCALYCGAQVDFVDIDQQTYNMSVTALQEKLERAEKTGALPKIIVPVNFSGQSCDIQAIRNLAERYGFGIIEDASHAIGGKYRGKPIGNCEFSDITVFSFHPVKLITTGEGGMTLTNNAELEAKLRRLSSHGITRATELMAKVPDGPWYYEQIELGHNYRITDIQAALGLSQLKRLDGFIQYRHKLAQRYDELLGRFPVILPWQNPYNDSAFHLYVIQLKLEEISPSRRDVFDRMRMAGIGVNVHYIPIYLQPYYQNIGFRQGYCVRSERYYERAITLPLHTKLTEEQQNWVVKTLEESLK